MLGTDHPHLPRGGQRLPITTYRLQLTPDFGFAQAQAVLPYISKLGVTDVYVSPILTPVPGSQHGYDVVDHSRINPELGGREAFEEFSREAHRLGLFVVVDIVPNHMAVPTPVWLNRPLWSVLKHGKQSSFARWFDVATDEKILMPILGSRIGQVLSSGELQLEHMVIPTEPQHGKQWVLRYYDHVFPVAEGTESLPLAVLVDRQPYRLAHWKVGNEELNYRRFFDVGTLAGIRVERPEVFEATHALLLELFNAGFINAFRVDHPDGLADPQGYLAHLSERTGGAWIAAEKILEGSEQLPADWPVAGTTGYDMSWRIHALQIPPRAAMPLGALMQQITGDSPSSWHEIERSCKLQILETSLAAEVRRVGTLIRDICREDIRLRDHTLRGIVECLGALVIEMPQYRTYIVPGHPVPKLSRECLDQTRQRAMETLDPDLEDTMDVICSLILGEEVGSAPLSDTDSRYAEVAVRFQQLCGAVMAKGVEDTAFYRWTHLVSQTEVGGDPSRFALEPDDFHAYAHQIQETWPATMSAGTTHDSKKGEDVRARLAALAWHAETWVAVVSRLRSMTQTSRPPTLDGRMENLLWQILAGTRSKSDPMTPERLRAYLTKAAREEKTWTTWTSPDEVRERELLDFASAVLADPAVNDVFDEWDGIIASSVRCTVLTSKALGLTVPGVADIYQGSEVTRSSLVDPDNRRPVDFAELERMLRDVRSGTAQGLDAEKFLVTQRIAQLRAAESQAFVSAESTYEALPSTSSFAVAFARGDSRGPRVVTVAQRLPTAGSSLDGWGDHSVVLPEGQWLDVLSGRSWPGGSAPLGQLLASFPVAVLRHVDAASMSGDEDEAAAPTPSPGA
ncbi:malto-oligosyltrehalose synthase [Schaalia sp. ZJ405]|uniref:malto-oligosyltrehalose synthase n=1 Tax=Schaalia sp. ZJ405 TaxID=2709403 RepID=UPI0013EBD0C3|nr:malto-oligosyltrehalose synthase [Schaalia sp. ZJ405]QPK80544.1 malto-oligosyltrehalose synthase [Schaalia sp. ZJ405]